VLRTSSGKAGLGAGLDSCNCVRLERGIESGYPPCLASPGKAGAAATAETRGRLGSIFTNQFSHAVPDRRAARVVRESRLRGGLDSCDCVYLERGIESGCPPCFASPGGAGAAATAETRGRGGSIFANQFDHAVPDRRAARVVRESRLRGGLAFSRLRPPDVNALQCPDSIDQDTSKLVLPVWFFGFEVRFQACGK